MAARFSFMPLLDEIEPLKQAALTELKAAVDLPALEQSKGAWIGPNGKFTALMKQLGTLSKEEKPIAGKAVNAAKVTRHTNTSAQIIADPQRRASRCYNRRLPAG